MYHDAIYFIFLSLNSNIVRLKHIPYDEINKDSEL